jgi:hypothetical protein
VSNQAGEQERVERSIATYNIDGHEVCLVAHCDEEKARADKAASVLTDCIEKLERRAEQAHQESVDRGSSSHHREARRAYQTAANLLREKAGQDREESD